MGTTNILDLNNRVGALEKKEDQDTTDYEKLSNLPKINSNTLSGNKTTSDLGINADNVMMSDGVTSVEDALDELAKSYTLKWSGEKYTVNETVTIPDFDSTKKYLFVFRTFTVGGFVENFVVLGKQQKIQITFFGDSTQFCRYRFQKSSESSNVYTVTADSVNMAENNALIEIYEIS